MRQSGGVYEEREPRRLLRRVIEITEKANRRRGLSEPLFSIAVFTRNPLPIPGRFINLLLFSIETNNGATLCSPSE
jgi:hypothetical protein